MNDITNVRELIEENEKLRNALLEFTRLANHTEVPILINFDIEDERAGKSVRIYTNKGKAVGRGELLTNKNMADSFFGKGYMTYMVNLDFKKLLKELLKDD